ncbi:hypothetical protein Nmel_013407 [Mimus melanotis]
MAEPLLRASANQREGAGPGA